MTQELKDPYTRSALEASGAAAAPGVEPVSEETIRVLIADDDCSVLDVLSDVVLRDPSLELTATAADADEAIELAARCRPAVALIDVRMPGGGGPRATLEIRRQSPATQVIALSAHRDRRSVLDMIGAGAVGYVVKGPGVEEVLAAIKRSAAGRSTLSPEVAREVIHHVGGQLSRERQEEEQRLQVIDRVREAIDGSVLRMAFQPIACLHTGRVAG